MRSDYRTYYVKCILRIAYPVAQGFICGILKGFIPAPGRNYSRTQHFHPLYVGFLPGHICFAHINNALQAHKRTYCSSGYSMLACSGLSYYPCFPHFFCKEYLPDSIVYFMGTGMIQIFPFKIDTGAILFTQSPGMKEGGRSSCIIGQQHVKFIPELFRFNDIIINSLQLFNILPEHFRDECTAILAVIAFIVRYKCLIHNSLVVSPYFCNEFSKNCRILQAWFYLKSAVQVDPVK